MTDSSPIIAERLKSLLAWHPEINTQEKLAKQLDLQQSSVSKWLAGRALPVAGRIIDICDVFGVSSDYLLGRSDVMTGLPPNSWLVDLDYVDEIKRTGVEPEDGGLAAAVPEKHCVLSSKDYLRFKRELVDDIRGRHANRPT